MMTPKAPDGDDAAEPVDREVRYSDEK